MSDFDYKSFYLSFNGRASRSDYLLKMVLPYVVLNIVLNVVSPMISMIFSLVALWPYIVVTAKRLHDRNKSGWMQLIYIIPILGWIWWIIEAWCLRGTVGSNKFGADRV